MFWKKKRNSAIFVNYETHCKRSSFRYSLSEKKKIEMLVGNTPVKILNISAFGAGIQNVDFIEREDYPVKLSLPRVKKTITTTLSIVYIDKNDICHCVFKTISEKEADSIHQYVFERQMEDIKQKKVS